MSYYQQPPAPGFLPYPLTPGQATYPMPQPVQQQQVYPPVPSQQTGYQMSYPQAPTGGQPSYYQPQLSSYPAPQLPQSNYYPASQAAYPPAPPSQHGYFPPQPSVYPPGHQQSHVYFQPQAPAMTPEIYAPSVRPDPQFNAQKDCEALRRAMKGLGTDETALIAVLCKRSWQQRDEIQRTYKQMFGKDLDKEITSETSGNFQKVLKRLLKTPIELAAYELRHAIEGAGTDEECLVEIICTKTNQELQAINYKYRELYGRRLEDDISGDTSGYFRRLLISLLSCNRPPDSAPDFAGASVDARGLYEAGERRLGTDEARFNAILCARSYSQLRAIFDCYARDYKRDIFEVIRSEFSGDIQKALLAVVSAIRNRAAYFAERLYKSMAGAGTRDEMLLRIVVMHCDFDLGAIKDAYQRIYGKSLAKTVRDDTSGDYKKALLALIGE